jgi:hypothetical protein
MFAFYNVSTHCIAFPPYLCQKYIAPQAGTLLNFPARNL